MFACFILRVFKRNCILHYSLNWWFACVYLIFSLLVIMFLALKNFVLYLLVWFNIVHEPKSTFYHFSLQKHQLALSKKWRHDEALKLMRDIYKCDYSTNVTTGYLKHVSKSENQFLIRHNGRVWKSCTSLLPSNVACFMPEFLNRVCPLFPTRFLQEANQQKNNYIVRGVK